MDYNQFSIEDLASDESFIAWVTGRSPESQRFWEEFVILHPEMRVKVVQARTLVLNLRSAQERPISEEQIENLWRIIDVGTTLHSTKAPRRPTYFPRYAIAAALCLAILAGFWYSWQFFGTNDVMATRPASTDEPSFIEEVNTSGNVLRIHLTDGSVVALENNSRLKYRADYTGRPIRDVYLTGEAFFDVERNPTQPFLVHSNDVVTRVLGTSFRVRAPEGNERVVVSVTSGRVSVYKASESEEDAQRNAVIVLPNEQVTYQRDLETFGRALVSRPEIVDKSVAPEDFDFESAPIASVFDVLERAYQVDIIFDEELMSNCFFTAPLGSEQLFEKLKIICRAVGAEYEVIDAKIVVTSSGC